MMDGENTCDRQNNHQSTNNHLSDGQATERSRMVRHNDDGTVNTEKTNHFELICDVSQLTLSC